MNKVFALYGVESSDLEAVARELSAILSAKAIPCENDYKGPYYRFGNLADEHVELVSGTSLDEEGEYPTETKFPDWPLLIYVSRADESSPWLHVLDVASDKFTKLKSYTLSEAAK